MDGARTVCGSWRSRSAFRLSTFMVCLGCAFSLPATASTQAADVDLDSTLRKIRADVPADYEAQEAYVAALAKCEDAVALTGKLTASDDQDSIEHGS